MINNFEQIKTLLKFENENEFYFLQVIQRKKENAELGRNNRLVKAYYIYSIEQLENYKEEIIKLCDCFNARAYIHLNRRNSKIIALELMELLAKNIKTNQINFLSKIYNTVCGKHYSEKDKSWIIDIDYNPLQTGNGYLNDLLEEQLQEIEPEGNKIIAKINTKNGYHLITKPFNRKQFSEIYPLLDVHTNNPTILYIS